MRRRLHPRTSGFDRSRAPLLAPARRDAVATRDAAAAVAAARPHVALCCWMPLGADWTAAFRRCPSVAAYVLVPPLPPSTFVSTLPPLPLFSETTGARP